MAGREYSVLEINAAKLLVNLFLRFELSDAELEKRTGFSKAKIREVFNNEELIELAFPNDGREKYLEIAKKHKVEEDDIPQLEPLIDLKLLGKTQERQIRMLARIALTYRLHLDSLASILRMDENELLFLIRKYNGGTFYSLSYLFENDTFNQEESLANFWDFYGKLKAAKDVKERGIVLKEVIDTDFFKMLKERKPGETITEEMVEAVLKFKLKYALDMRSLAVISRINYSAIKRNIHRFLESHPEYKREYEYQSDMFSDRYFKGREKS